MGEPIDLRERRELCDLMDELGPDAPTLCEGWTTLDLAAHLVLREHFKKWTGDRLTTAKSAGLPAIVQRLRAGAPLVPWRVPRVRTVLNGVEYFIHHEDVRRANGRTRRADRPDLDAMAWRAVGFAGRRVARQLRPHGLSMLCPDGRSRQIGPAGGAMLRGEPTELLLYLSGRRDAAEVTVDGAAEAVAALQQARAGM